MTESASNTAVERPSRRTPTSTAAGLCYLAVIAGGLFAEGIVRQTLIVPGEAEATANAILGDTFLWRIGLACHLVYLIPAMGVNVLVTSFFRESHPLVHRLALVFGVAAVSVEAVSLVPLYVPLALLEMGDATLSSADTPVLIYLGARLFSAGFAFSLLLFAGFCGLVGSMILRTRVVARWIGGMMSLAGACYVLNTVSMIVSPVFFDWLNPVILLPVLLAELSLALWLLIKGVSPVSAPGPP